MPTKSIFNTNGSYHIETTKANNYIELTLTLDKNWAKQLGLPNNKFYIRDVDTGFELHEHWLEQKLWAEISESAKMPKITDYYYPEDVYQYRNQPNQSLPAKQEK